MSEKLKLKTLVTSWCLPPGLNGSSNIVSNLARGFDADELVLAGELGPGPKDNQWDDEGGKKPAVYFIHKQWPWKFKKTVRLFLFPFILWRMSRVYKKTKCRQILAVFPNEIYSFMALIIARWNRVPFYSYFHNTYLDNRFGIKRTFASWLQPKIFRHSKIVFVMSEGMQTVLTKRYPGVRFEPLVHSFHGEIPQSNHRPIPDQSMKIGFMGNLNNSNLDAFSRFKHILEAFPDCQLTTYSGAADSLFREAGVSGKNVTHTKVGFDEVVDALKQHDLLFLPHGFEGGFNEIEYETIFPTRTIPYLLAGVPIVAHSPPNAFLTKWLRRHDCAEIVDTKKTEDLVGTVQRLISSPQRQSEIASNALVAAEQFQIASVVDLLKSSINEAQPAN